MRPTESVTEGWEERRSLRHTPEAFGPIEQVKGEDTFTILVEEFDRLLVEQAGFASGLKQVAENGWGSMPRAINGMSDRSNRLTGELVQMAAKIAYLDFVAGGRWVEDTERFIAERYGLDGVRLPYGYGPLVVRAGSEAYRDIKNHRVTWGMTTEEGVEYQRTIEKVVAIETQLAVLGPSELRFVIPNPGSSLGSVTVKFEQPKFDDEGEFVLPGWVKPVGVAMAGAAVLWGCAPPPETVTATATPTEPAVVCYVESDVAVHAPTAVAPAEESEVRMIVNAAKSTATPEPNPGPDQYLPPFPQFIKEEIGKPAEMLALNCKEEGLRPMVTVVEQEMGDWPEEMAAFKVKGDKGSGDYFLAVMKDGRVALIMGFDNATQKYETVKLDGKNKTSEFAILELITLETTDGTLMIGPSDGAEGLVQPMFIKSADGKWYFMSLSNGAMLEIPSDWKMGGGLLLAEAVPVVRPAVTETPSPTATATEAPVVLQDEVEIVNEADVPVEVVTAWKNLKLESANDYRWGKNAEWGWVLVDKEGRIKFVDYPMTFSVGGKETIVHMPMYFSQTTGEGNMVIMTGFKVKDEEKVGMEVRGGSDKMAREFYGWLLDYYKGQKGTSFYKHLQMAADGSMDAEFIRADMNLIPGDWMAADGQVQVKSIDGAFPVFVSKDPQGVVHVISMEPHVVNGKLVFVEFSDISLTSNVEDPSTYRTIESWIGSVVARCVGDVNGAEDLRRSVQQELEMLGLWIDKVVIR